MGRHLLTENHPNYVFFWARLLTVSYSSGSWVERWSILIAWGLQSTRNNKTKQKQTNTVTNIQIKNIKKYPFGYGSATKHNLKVHFVIHSLIPPFPTKKLAISTSVDTFRYIICLCAKYFLQIHLLEEIMAELAIYYDDMENIQRSGLCNKCNKLTIKCA